MIKRPDDIFSSWGKKNMDDIQMATKICKNNIEMYPSQLLNNITAEWDSLGT